MKAQATVKLSLLSILNPTSVLEPFFFLAVLYKGKKKTHSCSSRTELASNAMG